MVEYQSTLLLGPKLLSIESRHELCSTIFILYSLLVDSVALKKAIKCENYLKSIIDDVVAQMRGKKLFALIDKCDDLPETVQRGPCCAH